MCLDGWVMARTKTYRRGDPLPYQALLALPDGASVWVLCAYHGNPHRIDGVFQIHQSTTEPNYWEVTKQGVCVCDFTQTDPVEGPCREELAGADTKLYYAIT
jgi:hypothetical protein